MFRPRHGLAVLGMVLLPAAAGAAHAAWRLPAPVYRTVAAVAGGQIYVFGGHDAAGGTISDVVAADPATGVARRAGTLVLPTHGAAAANLAGRLLVFGGASTAVHDTVQQFLPASGTRVVGVMPGVRADVTAVVVGRRAILVGGFDGAGPQSAVWATADGRSFRVVARLPQAVRYPAVAAAGNAVYVFGGLISGGEYTGTFSNAIQRIWLPSGTAHTASPTPPTRSPTPWPPPSTRPTTSSAPWPSAADPGPTRDRNTTSAGRPPISPTPPSQPSAPPSTYSEASRPHPPPPSSPSTRTSREGASGCGGGVVYPSSAWKRLRRLMARVKRPPLRAGRSPFSRRDLQTRGFYG